MTRKANHVKPVGELGTLVVDGRVRSAKFTPVRYPGTKRDIEDYILRVALSSADEQGYNLYELEGSPIQNAEDDFDFTLHTRQGTEHLDLMEIAPLEKISGSYKDAPESYSNGEMADKVWKKLSDKSRRYGKHRPERIHLLLYTTDWRFRLTDGVLDLLRFQSQCGKHVFASIVYYSPLDQESGAVTILYPVSEALFEGFDEVSTRAECSERLDFSKFEIQPDGSVVLSGAPGHQIKKTAR